MKKEINYKIYKIFIKGYRVYTSDNEDIFGFFRESDNLKYENILVLINRAESSQTITLGMDCNVINEIDLLASAKKNLVEIKREEDGFVLDVAPKSFKLFSIKKIETRKLEEVESLI